MASTSTDPPPEYSAEIYLITNKINGKQYVGQASKTVGVIKNKWGTNARWKSHVREAVNAQAKGIKGHCVYLNNAIVKYGADAFEVKKLEDVTEENIDEREVHYIKEYNTLHPNGYNLDEGGARGKDSEETREKKRIARLGKKHSEETKKKISLGQTGNRPSRINKTRVNPEDADLPKYIASFRENGKTVGYRVANFPIGIENKSYINKCFIDKENPAQALEKAKAYLEEISEKYKDIPDQIRKKQESEKEAAKASTPAKKAAVERSARKKKVGNDKYDMPKYISLRIVNGVETGFIIGGLRFVDEEGNVKNYRKSFADPKYSMDVKLKAAKDHLEEVKRTHKCVLDDVKENENDS